MTHTLRSELESLLDLEELRALAREWLGFEAPSATTKASFVEHLMRHATETDSVAALCDAVAARSSGGSDRIAAIRRDGYSTEDGLGPGSEVGKFRLVGALGRSRSGTVFLATEGDHAVRLKILSHRGARDRERAMRYLAQARAAGAGLGEGLPRLLFAGQIDGRVVLAHEHFEGSPLSSWLGTGRPRALREVWPLVSRILSALSALHQKRFVHGSVRPENILHREKDGLAVALVDAGAHFVHAHVVQTSPEQLRGELPTPRSDLYAFGTLLYELVTGRAPFEGSPAELVAAHLSTQPNPPSFVAPHGAIEPEIDELLLDLLDKRPSGRPADAESVLELLRTLESRGVSRKSQYPAQELDALVTKLLENPSDAVAASLLESAVDGGADPGAVAGALLLASEQVERRQEARRLISRAAALLETTDDAHATEGAYRRLLVLDAGDDAGWAGLERLYRKRDEQDRVVELLLERSEKTPEPAERARILVRMAEVLENKMDDADQALVAYSQALCDDPSPEIADQIERLAGTIPARWNDVLSTATEGVRGQQSAERRHALLVRMAAWYAHRVGRPDQAKRCLESILLADPAHDAALSELSSLHRRARDWKALAEILLLRGNAAVAPDLARELWVEAASVLERELGDRRGAASLYEQVVGEDPNHVEANESLCRLYGGIDDKTRLIRTLSRWAAAAEPPRRATLFARLGGAQEQAGDLDAALQSYEEAVRDDLGSSDAYAGLERTAARLGRHEIQRSALEKQLRLATSPARRVVVLERLAKLYQVELLDPENAAVMLERLLEIDPSHAAASTDLAAAYEKLGRWDDHVRTLDRALRALPRGPERARRLVALGKVWEEQLAKPEAAAAAYEAALDIEPNLGDALDGIARISALLGDSPRATAALDALASGSSSGEARARNLLRAGQLLQKQGDLDGAIDRYRKAMESAPDHEESGALLRAAHLSRGDVDSAVALLERGMANGGSSARKAELGMELARLLLERRADLGGAEAVALRVVALDPTRSEALALLGEAARRTGRLAEAVKHYADAARNVGSLSSAQVVSVLGGYGKALAEAGDGARAVSVVEDLVRRFPDHREAWEVAAEVCFDHGKPERSIELHRELLSRLGPEASGAELSRLQYRLGESLLRAGKEKEAIVALEASAEADGTSTSAFRSLRKLFEKRKDAPAAIRTLQRHIERAPEGERTELRIAVGDLAVETLGDRSMAEESYLKALSDAPSDRRILVKLVELYTKGRDWGRLVDTVVKLSDMAPDDEQRAQRLLVAARVALLEVHDRPRARELIGRALGLAPDSDAVALEAISLRSADNDTEGLRALLERRIEQASRSADRGRALELGKRLADLHLSELHTDEAVNVYEAILRIAGSDPELEELLSDLYASDPVRYAEKAHLLAARILSRDPHRPDPYRSLLKLHGEGGESDGAFLARQALVSIERATSEEARLFGKFRSDGAIPTGVRLTEEDRKQLVVHPQVDSAITSVFSRIQSAMLASRARPLAKLGFREGSEISPSHPSPLVRSVVQASDWLGVRPPLLLRGVEQKAALSLVLASERCLSVSEGALSSAVPQREATFVAAAHVAYFLPGFAARGIVPTVLGLKAWLLAVIRWYAPRLAVPAEMVGPTADAERALERHLSPGTRDWLAEPVTELLHRGTNADVARWLAGVDMTSDRIGLIASGDLPTALSVVRAARDSSTGVSVAERVRELLAYSISNEYLTLRKRLRWDVEGRRPAPAPQDDIPPLSEREFQELT